MDTTEFQKAYGKLVAKAWEDDAFKDELFSDTAKVFKENGIELPEGLKVNLLENTEDTIHLVFPMSPSDELSDEQLENIDGGHPGMMTTICKLTPT